ncbi:peptidyl-prolyl cis-trans isomerase FKBP11 [Pezoporus wallicus]|uniref:peptidyl-prolyl cis-trans isomerase FKBP11 n=1 Tax=Pezoporus wallicus TaxID=35540 RepID=UPI00254B03E8|nr:peptidyl-prolyl cis-trans isomerase FKBP11 [Pezoporus wallicus]
MLSSGSCAGACAGNGAAVTTGVGRGNGAAPVSQRPLPSRGCSRVPQGSAVTPGAGAWGPLSVQGPLRGSASPVPQGAGKGAECGTRGAPHQREPDPARCRFLRALLPPAVTGWAPVLGGSPGCAAPEHRRTCVPDTGGGNPPLRPHRSSLLVPQTGPGGAVPGGGGGARGEHGAGRGGLGAAAAASPAMPSPAALLLLVLLLPPARAAESETETGARDLRLETLVPPPEGCTELSAPGDTVHIHYTGSLEDDGRIIDTSLSRDPLQVELGKHQVIPGLEQSLLDMCVGEKRRVIIPPHLAYGKRGSPPSIPGEAVLRFEVELVALSRAGYWQKVLNKVVPLLCLGLVPALLGLIGCHLYHKASSTRLSKKKMKEEKKNKAKRK